MALLSSNSNCTLTVAYLPAFATPLLSPPIIHSKRTSSTDLSWQEHLAATKGITHSDMDELESELARLRKLKAEKLTDMLKAAREEVSDLLEVSVSPTGEVSRVR